MQYLRLAKGLVNQQNQLVPLTQNLQEFIKAHPNADFYSSLYRYEDRHLEHFKKEHSVAGLRDVKTPKILFDFDDSQNIDLARKDAIRVCDRLVANGVEQSSIKIYFSGNKGFGVEVMTNQEMSRQEFVNVTFGLAGDLPTFDTRINDEARIIRVPLSKHPVSGLFKVPMSIDDLTMMSVDDVKALAKHNNHKLEEPRVITMPKKLDVLKSTEYKKIGPVKVETKLDFDLKDIDWAKCPKWMAKERYALQEGYFLGSESTDKGQRNTAFMILAATYRNQGFSAEHTLGLLMATADRQAARTGETPYTADKMEREVINTVFAPSWSGGIYGKDEELLQITRNTFNIQETSVKTSLVDINDVGSDFKMFARDIDKNTVKTGLKSLDENVLITSGMMVALLAAPGAGKTSFANMFVEHLGSIEEHTIYFSLDMYKNLLFNRLLQRYSGYDMRKIMHQFKDNAPDENLTKAYADVIKNYGKASFNFRSGPTVEEIEQEIINYSEEKGQNVKLVVVDYLEKVRGPFTDATANSAYVASRLSDIAKKYHTVVLLLVQPQKSAGDPREELSSYRKIKGASVIEQDSRVILTMSRPGYDPKSMDNDRFATISVVKNNMGNLCQLDFGWDGVSGQLSDLDGEGRKNLAELRKAIETKKNNEAFGDGITASFDRNSNFRKR